MGETMTRTPRSEGVLAEYDHAPQLLLVFPASRQVWKLRLTPVFARELATEVRRMPRALRGARRRGAFGSRRAAGSRALRPALIRRAPVVL